MVRGAPLLGVVGALGVALVARAHVQTGYGVGRAEEPEALDTGEVYRSLYSRRGGVGRLRRPRGRAWIDELDAATHSRVVQAIDTLAEAGPGLGSPTGGHDQGCPRS